MHQVQSFSHDNDKLYKFPAENNGNNVLLISARVEAGILATISNTALNIFRLPE